MAISSSSIEYRLLQPSQYEEAIQFIFEHFIPHEPCIKCLGYDKDKKTIDEAEKALLAPYLGDLSWCAVDPKCNDKMVGLQLNGIVKCQDLPDQPLSYEEYVGVGMPHKTAVQLVVEGEIINTKQILQQHGVDRGLQLLLLATHSDYKKLGIGTELAVRSLDHGAKESECRIALVTCSSFYTQKIFGDRLKFDEIGRLKYADYVFKGEYIFANMEEPHKYAICYEKKLETKG